MIFGAKFASVILDDTSERELALTNPKGFLEVHLWPIIIDEVQRVPNILSEIKIIIDTCDAIRPINDKAYSYPVFLLGI